LLCALGLAAVLAPGCQATKNTQTAAHDPLMGERVPEQPFGVAGPTPPPQNRAGMTGPSAPQATASKSNAAMLVPDPLLGAKPIAIADSTSTQPQKAATTGGWQAKDPQPGNPPGSAGGPGVILREPVPVPVVPIQPVAPPTNVPSVAPGVGAAVQPVPPPSAIVPTVAAGPGAAAAQPVSPVGFTDSDPLQTTLKSRGVIWQDQKTLDDGVHFTCRVVNSQDPNFVRVYEAIGPDYRSAVQAVLDQIDQQR